MGVCEVPVVSSVCHAASKAVSSVVSAPFEWVAQGVGGAAAWMFKGVWQLFESTTLVNLSEPGYLKVYDVLFGVAIFLMLLFFCLQLLTGLIGRDPGALRRAAIGLAKSVLGSFLVVTVVGLALEITDELCVGIVQATGNTLEEMGGKIAALASGIGAISLSAPGAGAVIIIFLGCLAITGAAIVWFSLLTRKALLLVAVVLAPFALSGQSWDAARGWVSKWAGFVAALIVSKLVVVVIFLVAVSQMSAPINLELSSIANPVAGVVLMFIAAFAPYMAYKFIAFIGIDVAHAMSVESEAKQATGRPLSVPGSSLMGSARKILGGGASDAGGGEDGGPSAPGGGGRAPGGDGRAPGGGGGAPGGQGGGGGGLFPGGVADGASQGEGGMSGRFGTAAAAGAEGGTAGGAVALGGLAGAAPGTAAAKAAQAGGAVARSAEQHAGAGHDAAAGASTSSPRDHARTAMGAVPQLPGSYAPAEPPGPAEPELRARTVPASSGVSHAPGERPAAPGPVASPPAVPAAPAVGSADPGLAADGHQSPSAAPAAAAVSSAEPSGGGS